MIRSFHLPAFVLVFALALAQAQTSPSSDTNLPPPPKPPSADQTPSTGSETGSPIQSGTGGDAQTQIQNAMKNDPRFSTDNIMVSVSGNAINLTGEVSSKEERNAAAKVAEKYAGSFKIRNHLQVSGGPGPSSNPPPEKKPEDLVRKSNDDGVQTFAGMAGGMATAQNSRSRSNAAAEAANNVPSHDGEAAHTALGPDGSVTGTAAGGLQSQIQNALRNEPTLAKDHFNVSVSDDQIDVSGSVSTAKEKVTAQRIVQSYAGDRKVKDQLAVNGHDHVLPQ